MPDEIVAADAALAAILSHEGALCVKVADRFDIFAGFDIREKFSDARSGRHVVLHRLSFLCIDRYIQSRNRFPPAEGSSSPQADPAAIEAVPSRHCGPHRAKPFRLRVHSSELSTRIRGSTVLCPV